jgi:hypothetical protein
VKTEFTGPVYLEIVDAKSASKPLTQLQVVNVLREGLGLDRSKIWKSMIQKFWMLQQISGQ